MTGLFHRSYNAEDADHDVFTRFAHDVAQCMKGLQFVSSQNERISRKYWPEYFQTCLDVGEAFRVSLGENSLEFKEKADFYARFDQLNAHSLEHYTVHPKEKTFTVASLDTEILVYLSVVSRLKDEISDVCDVFSRELSRKIVAITVHLKHIQSRLKLRESLHSKCVKLERKTGKLGKKSLEADVKSAGKVTAEYDELSAKLASVSAKLQALTTKLKLTLPESLLLVEEFVTQLAKWAICRNHDISAKVQRSFREIGQDFGFLIPPNNVEVPDWESIETKWEIDATPPRLRAESLLSAVFQKNPDLIDEEVSGTDHSSKTAKTWSKLTMKVKEKHHEVKPKDRSEGIFHDHQMADPLSSYLKFHNQSINVSETYHPSKIVEKDEVIDESAMVRSPVPPPLPPRDESQLIHVTPLILVSPQFSHKSTFSSLPKTPTPGTEHSFLPPPYSPVSSSIFGRKSSEKSPRSESQLSLASEVNETISSSVESGPEPNFFLDIAEEKLVKLYNGQKNEITNAPLTTYKVYDLTSHRQLSDDLTDPKNSQTLKLLVLRRFYDKFLAADTKKEVTAKSSFSGVNPGDLLVKNGDKIGVVFDLQDNITTFAKSGENWVVGATGKSEAGPRRIGFVPNTCF